MSTAELGISHTKGRPPLTIRQMYRAWKEAIGRKAAKAGFGAEGLAKIVAKSMGFAVDYEIPSEAVSKLAKSFARIFGDLKVVAFLKQNKGFIVDMLRLVVKGLAIGATAAVPLLAL